jgi:hypothetical protein
MTLRIRFRQPAPAAKKVCQHCENRRSTFRAQGIATWDPYYALCYKCYQRYVTHAQAAPVQRDAAAIAARRPRRTPALETGLMTAQ